MSVSLKSFPGFLNMKSVFLVCLIVSGWLGEGGVVAKGLLCRTLRCVKRVGLGMSKK